MRPQLIAIDGPVAAGKSSVGRLLARRLGYHFFDTGNMYRALTWRAIELGINLEDEASLVQLATNTRIDLTPSSFGEGEAPQIRINGQDISSYIRSPEVERGVAVVSKVAGVRKAMVSEQRRLVHEGKIVMAGRDIGTVVLPEAELKVYLVASAGERARRRYQELIAQGDNVDYDSILAELRSRDEIDSQRPISPLRPAADARIIDTEKLTLEEVVDKVYSLVEGS